MNKIILILLLNMLFISCKEQEKKISINQTVLINKKDTIFIENNQVLFITPSSDNFEEMKKRMGEENFYTIADDANFYGANAYQFLDSLKVSYKSANSTNIIAYKKKEKTIIISPLQEKWYSLLNKEGKLIEIDLVTFEDDYKKILLKPSNKQDISLIMRENISTPEKIIDNLIFTKDKKDNLEINTEILDYVSKTTTRKNSNYLFALENFGYENRNSEYWSSDEMSKIKAYIFNTTYPLRKKYWNDKFNEWYSGKPENYLGDGLSWKENNYYGLPKLEEYVDDFRSTYWKDSEL